MNHYFCTMLITVMRSNLHHLTITQVDLNYVGSITIDEDLLDAAGLIEGEKVQIMNINNGERLETYIIVGERGFGEVCMNGPSCSQVFSRRHNYCCSLRHTFFRGGRDIHTDSSFPRYRN